MQELVPTSNQNLPAEFNLETFKSLYYWINARPDTHVKLYEDEKIVSLEDILRLNDKIQKKIENHDIFTNITSITLSFDDGEIQSFNAWQAFKEYQWTIPSKTESISLLWDISVKLPNYQLAQKHTLKVRIGSSLRPNELFHIMTNSDDILEINETVSFIVCKVDFINVVLSKELIFNVTEWYKTLKPVEQESKILKFVSKQNQNIARAGHYLTTFIGLCLLYLAFRIHFHYIEFDNYSPKQIYLDAFLWLLLIFSVYFVFNLLGSIFGQKIYTKINSYKSRHCFHVTTGDQNEQAKIEAKNRKISSNLFWNFLIRIIISISTFIANNFISK